MQRVQGLFSTHSRSLVAVAGLISLLHLSGAPLAARTGRANLVYILNNNPVAGQNAVLGYSRNADGSLVDLAGSPFFTSGTGYRNVDERIGPDDTDGELIVSADKQYMFAVNEGSDSISVFRIRLDGSLRLVQGSPFYSGGKGPCSLAIANDFLYVVNRGDGILPTADAPAYTQGTIGATNVSVFQIGFDGSLTQQTALTMNTPDGSSPSQVVVSPDGQFLFGGVFMAPSSIPAFAPFFPAAQSLLLSAAMDEDDGSFESQPMTPLPSLPQFTISGAFRPFMLGMRPHPTQSVLYVGAVTAGVLTVWTWDSGGNLTFSESVNPGTLGGAGGLCWVALDSAARWLYSSSVGPDSIGAFSLADPLHPVLLQNFALGGPKGPLPTGTQEPYTYTTAPFNLAVDPAGKFLYVVNHGTCTSDTIDAVNCPAGNAMHILQINADGTLTETPASPMVFPLTMVPSNTHPKGLVVM